MSGQDMRKILASMRSLDLLETVNENETVLNEGGDDIERLVEIHEEMRDLAREAFQLVRATGDTMAERRSEGYWYNQIMAALGSQEDSASSFNGQMFSMYDIISDLTGDDGIEESVWYDKNSDKDFKEAEPKARKLLKRFGNDYKKTMDFLDNKFNNTKDRSENWEAIAVAVDKIHDEGK